MGGWGRGDDGDGTGGVINGGAGVHDKNNSVLQAEGRMSWIGKSVLASAEMIRLHGSDDDVNSGVTGCDEEAGFDRIGRAKLG